MSQFPRVFPYSLKLKLAKDISKTMLIFKVMPKNTGQVLKINELVSMLSKHWSLIIRGNFSVFGLFPNDKTLKLI